MNKRNNLLELEVMKPATMKAFVKEVIESLEAFESGRIDSFLFVRKTTNAVIDLSEAQEYETTQTS
jgi:hypothetical protein